MNAWLSLTKRQGLVLARALVWAVELDIPLASVLGIPPNRLVRHQRLQPSDGSLWTQEFPKLNGRWMSTAERHQTATKELAAGRPLSEVLTEHFRWFFTADYLATVRYGERTGQLPLALNLGLSQLEQARQALNVLQTTLSFLALVLMHAVLAILGVLIFVLPKFADMWDMEQDYPWYSHSLLAAGHWLSNPWLAGTLVVGLVLVVAALICTWLSPLCWRLRRLLHWLPLVGPALQEYQVHETAISMARALDSGESLSSAASLTANLLRNPFEQRRLRAFARQVEQGAPWTDAWADACSPTALHQFLLRNSAAREQPAEGFSQIAEDAVTSLRARLGLIRQYDRVILVIALAPAVSWIVFGTFGFLIYLSQRLMQ